MCHSSKKSEFYISTKRSYQRRAEKVSLGNFIKILFLSLSLWTEKANDDLCWSIFSY